jgi:hypothetical protein
MPLTPAPSRKEFETANLNTKSSRRTSISRNVLAHVMRVDSNGSRYVLKRFARGAHRAWALEVAAHIVCPRPEVPAIQSFGFDVQHHGWLCTPWFDAHNAREHLYRGNHVLRQMAHAWITDFQSRLAIQGYRWADAAMRNLLVLGDGSAGSPFGFKAVDYTVSALIDANSLEGNVQQLMSLQPGEHHELILFSPGGHLKIPHPWAGQTPPPDGGGTRDDYAV